MLVFFFFPIVASQYGSNSSICNSKYFTNIGCAVSLCCHMTYLLCFFIRQFGATSKSVVIIWIQWLKMFGIYAPFVVTCVMEMIVFWYWTTMMFIYYSVRPLVLLSSWVLNSAITICFALNPVPTSCFRVNFISFFKTHNSYSCGMTLNVSEWRSFDISSFLFVFNCNSSFFTATTPTVSVGNISIFFPPLSMFPQRCRYPRGCCNPFVSHMFYRFLDCLIIKKIHQFHYYTILPCLSYVVRDDESTLIVLDPDSEECN